MSQRPEMSDTERSAYIDAFLAWRDIVNEREKATCDQLDVEQEWYVPDNKDGLRMWHEWRNTIVRITMDELDKWCDLAERLGWDATMEWARNV